MPASPHQTCSRLTPRTACLRVQMYKEETHDLFARPAMVKADLKVRPTGPGSG